MAMSLSLSLGLSSGGSSWTPISLPSIYRWGEARKWDGSTSYLDLSGNGKTMTGSGTNTLVTDGSGYPAMRSSNGAGDYFQRVEATTFGPTTISLCINVTSSASKYASAFSADVASGGDFQIDSGVAGQYRHRFNSTSLGAAGMPIGSVNLMNAPHVLTTVIDTAGGIVRQRVDGVEVATTTITSGAFTTDKFTLFGNRSLLYGLGCDHYGEVINGSVDAGEIALIETYLGNRAGLSI